MAGEAENVGAVGEDEGGEPGVAGARQGGEVWDGVGGVEDEGGAGGVVHVPGVEQEAGVGHEEGGEIEDEVEDGGGGPCGGALEAGGGLEVEARAGCLE